MGPLYIVTERFDSGKKSEWDQYVSWSGLTHLREVVSLDSMLCPRVVDNILPDDWNHIVNEDFMLEYFTDLEYLLGRARSIDNRNLLCLYKNPTEHPAAPDSRFQFEGYDLVDVQGGVSALTNCGGFPLAFESDELNEVGLLPRFERAAAVGTALRSNYPNEHHAKCDVWAIFRARS